MYSAMKSFYRSSVQYFFHLDHTQGRAESPEAEVAAPCACMKSQQETRGQVVIPFSHPPAETMKAT